MNKTIPSGGVIGVLGGGQLGRMLSVAAGRLGYKTHIYEPFCPSPAVDLASQSTHAPYTDIKSLESFAHSVDVITYEFENIPLETIDILAQYKAVRPGRYALEIAQDRLSEKDFLNKIGLQTAPYHQIDTLDDLHQALESLAPPSILKTRRLGYDGKGQVAIRNVTDAEDAYRALQGAPAILEGFVSFQTEISVIAARGLSGEIVCFDPGENVHRDGILHTTTVPAKIPSALKMDAVLIAGRILNALEYVGVMGIELFVTKEGLVVNEIAPRVHNSGHWTQNGCVVDQFEQHIRAIAGLPLGKGLRHSDVEMQNLLGTDATQIDKFLRDPDTAIHLYGKAEAKEGRKMGHINRILHHKE